MAIKSNRAAIIAAARRGALRGLVAGMHEIVDEATSLQHDTPRTGRTYRRRGVEHVASSPGNSPAPDTGTLVGSARVDLNAPELTVTATWTADYALALEMGTENVAARPFVRPALAKRADDAQRTVLREITAEIVRATK